MNAFHSAFWSETLKTYRSKASWGTTAAFLLLPLFGGLFMIILKNPEQARAMGLIGVKAQLAGGVADWPTYLDILLQGSAIGGAILFSFITAWVFGREFSDHTVKELLAIPTPRSVIVGAKFVLIALWIFALTILIFVIGLGIGMAVDIPGWSSDLVRSTFGSLLLIAFLNLLLMPFVALFASAGRGYLPALGWAVLTVFFSQILSVLGWGDWFPWSVPVVASGMIGPRTEQIGMHSYMMVTLAFLTGLAATFTWWRSADQAR